MADARYISLTTRLSTNHMQNVRRDRAIELIDDYSDVVGALLDHAEVMDKREADYIHMINLLMGIAHKLVPINDPKGKGLLAQAQVFLDGLNNAPDNS